MKNYVSHADILLKPIFSGFLEKLDAGSGKFFLWSYLEQLEYFLVSVAKLEKNALKTGF